MKRLAPIFFALAIMCGCGRYPGFSGTPQGFEAGAAVSPSASTGAGDDIPATTGPGFIQGNAFSGGPALRPAATPTSTKGASQGAHAGSKGGKGNSSSTNKPKAGTGRNGGSTHSGGPVSGNRNIQARILAGARHNKRILPNGFPFVICPVQGRYSYSDDFGAPRCSSGAAYCGGYHLHMGNDILAGYGTPIVAPFDGRAVNATNLVGGNSVIVYGAQGFVFNAHLVAFGKLGQVTAGTVVGFVGNTGDARGGPTHDHFEWHPNSMPSGLYRSAYGQTEINGAIDPYPYLRVVCPPG